MKIIDFFSNRSSSHVAKDRLKLVLVSDRANCSPDLMEQIKNDIIHVLSKYVEIDFDGLDIKFEHTDAHPGTPPVPVIFANIPILSMKQTK